jgi:hypothetical protein
MPKVIGWKELRNAIGKLRPEGEDGFEGLVRALFESETGKSFYLARKGDQPVGDVFSPRAGVALEAKHYKSKAQPSERAIEGEIDDALCEVPALDVFVVAATKPLGQLAARLAKKTRATGLDILLLHLGDDLSEFAALCVAHWQVILRFIPRLDPTWQKWAATELAKPETQASLQRLREDLRGLATRSYVSEQSGQQLNLRFRGEGAGARAHNPVFLSEAVPRTGINSGLRSWWGSRDVPIAVLEGEDGMGKTWVAAAFVESLLKEEVVVFWFDSLSWGQTESVENLVEVALRTVFVADEPLRGRIKRKIFHLWKQSVLLVLDGANERNAWKAAERILYDYSAHKDKLVSQVRLLFTSRPLEGRATRHEFWKGCCVIPVGPFNEAEFRAAVAKTAPTVAPEIFTSAVRELAVVPRYFRLCVRLRERLATVQHLNKQVLFWAELQEKLASGDPQLAALGEELLGNPVEVLARLAQQAGWPRGGKASLDTEELKRTFPNFLNVRTDLIEQRIVLDADFDLTALSADHVVLGWALALWRLAERHADEEPDRLRDLLLRELEPAGSDDDKVRAVHVAALLAFLDDRRIASAVKSTRASLLSLWVTHHNAAVNHEALSFFLRSDLGAYVSVVEVLFRGYMSSGLETALLSPLAETWRDKAGDVGGLREVLKRWLRLIYPGDASGSKDGDRQPLPQFIAAESREQLRLSYAAIGVISFRPESDLLPALLDCQRSQDFCYTDRDLGRTKHRYPIKSPHGPLGPLLRWSYTEAIMPDLQTLSATMTPGSADANNLLCFARLLRMAELPPQIGLAEDIHLGEHESSRRQVETLRQWLGRNEPGRRQMFGLGNLGCLAARRDLPKLEDSDVQVLCAEVQQCLAAGNPPVAYPGTWENRQLHDMLPWIARYAPNEFDNTCLTLWQQVLGSRESVAGLMDLDELMPGQDPGGHLVEAILRNAHTLLGHPNYEAGVSTLTELMLLHGSLEQIVEWLEYLEDRIFERTATPIVGLNPIPEALENLAPAGLAKRARERFDRAFADSQRVPNEPKFKRFAQHWLQVYSYTVKPTKEVGGWALALVETIGADKASRFSLFHLLCGCTDTDVFRQTLQHPAFRPYQLGINSWRWARCISPSAGLFSFEQLKSKTSFTVSGSLLECSEQDDELRKWGRSLASATLAVLEMDEADARTEGAIEARRELIGFNAAGALLRWSQLEPEAFVTFAEQFLQSLYRSGLKNVMDLNFFADSVAIGLLRLKPERAMTFSAFRTPGFTCQLFSFDKAFAWETRELWSSEFNDNAEILRLRRQLLVEAPNDEVLFWHVAAAHARENTVQITRLADEWLAQPVARDRVLGITLLAFLGDTDSVAKLSESSKSDASFWGREHAAWAADVCALELACKQRYRETLQSSSLTELARGLAELRSACSPMAQVWRHSIEHKVGWPLKDSRMRGYLELFWYHWGNTSSRKENFGILGRNLRGHCRGEHLDEGLASRQSPWWRL